MPNPTLKSVIFWQWANQSLNGEPESWNREARIRFADLVCRAVSLRQLRECEQEHSDEQRRDRMYARFPNLGTETMLTRWLDF